MREELDAAFSDIFKSSTDYSNILDTVINIPRIYARQRNKGNIPAETLEEYYCLNILVPLLDKLIAHLKSRFSIIKDLIKSFSFLMSENILDSTFENILPLYRKYKTLLLSNSDCTLRENLTIGKNLFKIRKILIFNFRFNFIKF